MAASRVRTALTADALSCMDAEKALLLGWPAVKGITFINAARDLQGRL